MDFFKDPKYKSIRIILLLVILVGAGWFIVSNMNLSKSNQGRVIDQAPTVAPKTDEAQCGEGGDDCPCCTGYLCHQGQTESWCKAAIDVFGPKGGETE